MMFTKVFDKDGTDVMRFDFDDDDGLLLWLVNSGILLDTNITVMDALAMSQVVEDDVFEKALEFPCSIIERGDGLYDLLVRKEVTSLD